MKLSMASPTVMEEMREDDWAAFSSALMAAASAMASFSLGAVTETRFPSTITWTFQEPEGSFLAFGSFT